MKQQKQRLNKWLVAAGALVLALLLIWVYPMSMKTAYMQFSAPSLPEGTTCEFVVHSAKAYEPQYALQSTLIDGVFLVKLDREYLSADRVGIANEQVAAAITRLELRGNAVGLSDYTAATLEAGVVENEAPGIAVLSAAALETIQDGLRHPWMMRLLLTVALVLILAVCATFAFLRKRFGVITTLTVFGITLGCACFLAGAKMQGLLEKTIPLGQRQIANGLPIVLLTCIMALLVVLCLLIKENTKGCKAFIVVIYVAALLLGVGKMAFYSERVANTPDEAAHIGYVAYLTKTGELIPRFEKIELASCLEEDDHTMLMHFTPGSMSYLKHPPTYYHIMRLANAVEFHENGTFTVAVERMRVFSMMFVVAAMVLMFYLGFTRLKKEPVVHLLYAAVCTMVPMLMYTASGVNNDSFSLLTVTLFFWGIVRYLEKKRNAATYLLITAGISLSVITKVTAGIVVALTALLVLAFSLYKERHARELFKRPFLLSLLVLLIPAAYFGYVFLKYGGIQPNMFSLCPEYSRTTGFYIEVTERSSKSFVQYILYFFKNFFATWTGISSHIALVKSTPTWSTVGALMAIWFVPVLYTKRSLRDKTPYSVGVIAGCVSVVVAVVMQLFNGYNVFVGRGYPGGFQSRYYLCAIVFFAFAAALAVEYALGALERNDALAQRLRRVVKAVTVFYVGVLFYEDILYFLLHYSRYM